MLKAAFNSLIALQGRSMIIRRAGVSPIEADIKAAPSNYFRNLQGPSDIVIPGKEFVISKDALTAAGFPSPKRNDRLVDEELGVMTISEVREMFDLKSSIIGYRLRTS